MTHCLTTVLSNNRTYDSPLTALKRLKTSINGLKLPRQGQNSTHSLGMTQKALNLTLNNVIKSLKIITSKT